MRRCLVIVAGAWLAVSAGAAWADKVDVQAWAEPGLGRISFDWPSLVGFRAKVEGDKLRIVFNRPIETDLSAVAAKLPGYVSGGHVERDGQSVVFDLVRKISILSFRYGDSVAFHLIPVGVGAAAETSPTPALAKGAEEPPAPSVPELPEILVRAGIHPDRNRLVFDWPSRVDYELDRSGDTVRVRFARPARADLRSVERTRLRNVNGAEQALGSQGLEVRLDVLPGAEIRHFRNGNSVVVDVYDPPSKPDAAVAEKTDAVSKRQAVADAAPPEPGQRAEPAPGNGSSRIESRLDAPMRLVPPPEPAARPAVPAIPAAPAEAAGGAASPQADQPSILADPGQPSSAAVFLRAGYLYLLFDRPVPDGGLRVQAIGGRVGEPEPLALTEGYGVRMALREALEPRVGRSGTQWVVTLVPPSGERPPSLPVEGDPEFLLGARAIIRTGGAGPVVSLADPTVGDRLKVILLPEPGKAVTQRHQFLQARILPAAQGVVVRQIDDRVAVRPIPDGFELTAEGGLLLSPAADAEPVQPAETPVGLMSGMPAGSGRLFDLTAWRRGGLADFNRARRELQHAVIEVPEEERNAPRLALARFYFAHGNAAEALGLLDLISASRPELTGQPEFRALRGAARVLAGDDQGARGDLDLAVIGSGAEARLWRAAADAGVGDWAEAARGFDAAGKLLDDYPLPAYRDLALLAAEAAVEAGDADRASHVIEGLEARLPHGDRLAAVRYLRGRIHAMAGKVDEALEAWRAVADGGDRLYRTRAEFDMANLELAQGRITPEQAIDQLERLRFAWRGDALELSILRRLGEVYFADKKYALGFETLRTALALFPESPQAADISRQIGQTFTGLFLKDGAGALPALDALALYDEFKDLAPKGEDGDTIARKLADRLVEVDLLDRAAAILSDQVDDRLQGVQKARVGARLASIRLLDGKPAEAIAALDRSAIPGIPADLATQRLVLHARALADQGKFGDALALLAPETGKLADLLRVDIAWRGKRWPEAADALARVIGPAPAAGAPLAPETSQLVLNRAVALALAGDSAGVARLRDEFGPVMATGPDANSFRVLTRPDREGGLVDPASIRARMEEVDVFKSFLAGYRADGRNEAVN